MKFQRLGGWMPAMFITVAMGVGCGSNDGPQVSRATGFFQGEPASKFTSAIFDVKEHSPGRQVTYVFLGHDENLCEKVKQASTLSDAHGVFNGPLVAAAWTNRPKNPFDDHYGPDSERVTALSTGIPNKYKYLAAFTVDHRGEIIGDHKASSKNILVRSINQDSIKGYAYFGSENTDAGSLDYEARKCEGLAGVAQKWFTK